VRFHAALKPVKTAELVTVPGIIESTGHKTQTADVVAHSVIWLMRNPEHRGNVILSSEGRYWEMEGPLLSIATGLGSLGDTERIMDGLETMAKQSSAGIGSIPGSSS
jgi:hypothetical protein